MPKRVPILFALLLALSSQAQIPEPDPAFWMGGARNPSGDFAVPVIAYNRTTGVMAIDTRGLDGVRTTTDPQLIADDDVGLISLTVEGPPDWQVMDIGGFMPNPNIGGAVVWSNPFFITKPHLLGVGAGAEFLEPGVWDIFQFEPGFGAEDFGSVEVAVNFGAGMPGATMFGSVQIVPEPTALTSAVIFVIGLLLQVRSKGTR